MVLLRSLRSDTLIPPELFFTHDMLAMSHFIQYLKLLQQVAVTILRLQIGKPRLREMNCPIHFHTARRKENWGSNPGLLPKAEARGSVKDVLLCPSRVSHVALASVPPLLSQWFGYKVGLLYHSLALWLCSEENALWQPRGHTLRSVHWRGNLSIWVLYTKMKLTKLRLFWG